MVISIRAPVQSATKKTRRDWKPRYFDSRTRMGCDITTPAVDSVSIRAPAWDATMQSSSSLPLCSFLFAHPHEVRHLDCQDNRICQISIHAPAQGATVITITNVMRRLF